jgi:hypothetical protein
VLERVFANSETICGWLGRLGYDAGEDLGGGRLGGADHVGVDQ